MKQAQERARQHQVELARRKGDGFDAPRPERNIGAGLVLARVKPFSAPSATVPLGIMALLGICLTELGMSLAVLEI